MRVLVDTNILLRSVQPNHPLSSQATHAVAKLIRQNDEVFFGPQNIAEFWNVATRPADRNGLGWSPEEAAQEVENIEKLLTLLPEVPSVYGAWKQIVTANKVQGVKVHDARLVAIMSVYVVESILTFNTADFERFGVRTIHPSSLVP
jgi:predicted nucleic acid-binding protein